MSAAFQAVSSPQRTPRELIAAARALGVAGGASASRLLALLYDPDVALERVLACLNAEPALAARVLKVANAPYYRQSGRVGTVAHAVQLLGLEAVRGVAAAGCLDRLTPPRMGLAFDPQRFRRHCLAVACAAQQLSAASGPGLGSEAFMAGLLHDIGLLLLTRLDADAMGRFVPVAPPDPTLALAAERAHFGTTHADCAEVLLEAWATPAWLRAAVAGHHADAALPPAAGMAPLAALIQLADHVAERAGLGLWPLYSNVPDDALLGVFGLVEADVDAAAAALPELVARFLGEC